MKNMFIAPLGAAMVLAMATPAFAQGGDKVDWTGPYIGGSLGYNWQPKDNQENLRFDTDGDGNFNNQVTTSGGLNAFEPGFCGGAATTASRTRCKGDKDAVGWLGHVGYDYQMGNIVAGVVVEGGKSYISDSVSGFSRTPASYTMTRRLDWNAAGRLRLGYTTDSGIMPYITGGVAYAKVKNSFSSIGSANAFSNTQDKDGAWGFTTGGGVEAKVADNFSIGVLYRYTRYNLSDYTVNVTQGGTAANNPFIITPAGSTDIQRGDKLAVHSTMVTASFRF